MKRPITNLVIGLLALFASHLAAQPTFTVSPQTVTGNVGDVVTVNILVDNFTDILSFQYTMNWNASVLQFQQPVGNVNPSQLSGMTSGSFGLTLASTGKITVSWSDLNATGVSVSNGTLIYSLNFLVLSANTTTIGFTDNPAPREVVKVPGVEVTNASTFLPASFSGAGGNGGGGGGGGGNNPPVNGFAIIGSDETAANGDQVCVDVTVNDFIDIQSVQYTMEFDESKWQFANIPASSYGLPGLASGSFGTTQTGQGYINFSWSDTGGGAVTLTDGTVIYQVCLNAIGPDNCGSTTPFEFNSEAVPVEVIDINNQTVPFQGISGDLEVCGNGGGGGGGGGGNNPPVNGFAIIGSDEIVETGEQACVDVTVNDFIDIQSVQYTMEFDETKWQFANIPQSSYGLPGLAAGSFGTTQTGQGYINFSWSDTGGGSVTLTDGTVIYQVCLNAIGANNCNSTTLFEFNGEAVPIEVVDIDNQTVPFQGISGELEICDDPNGGGGGGGGGNYTGLTFVAGEVESPASTQVCVDYKVYNFDCVTSAQFTIHFNQNITQYLGVQAFGLPDLTAANFGTTQTANGTLNFSWPSPDPANGTSIPDGTTIFQICFNVIGTNGQVSNLTFDGNPTIVEAGSCNSSNEPVNFDPGSVTVGVSCTGPVTIASSTVTNVSCAGQSNGGVAITTAGGSSVKTYVWKNAAGNTVSTSQNLTGVPAGVYSVTVTSCAGAQTTTSQFTITQPTPLNLNFTATDVVCFGETNGAVDITVTGGTTSGTSCTGYTYAWSNGATTQDISGLPIGNYTVTVTDCNSCTIASPIYIVSGSTSAMTVSISVNNVSCFGGNNGGITVTATGGGPNKQYRINGGTWVTTSVFPNLNGGTYTVQVRDNYGCVKSESVTVTEPAVIAITTTATNPSPGQNNGSITTSVTGGVPPYTYSWSGPNGSITPSPGPNPINLAAGTYCVTVTDANNCSKQKCQLVSAPITDNPLSPSFKKNSCAGSPCNGSITVSVIGGIAPYTYAWTSSNGTVIGPIPDPTGLCAGNYSVTVTSPSSGQSWTQTFTITQPTSGPQAFPFITPPTTSAACNGSIELAVSGGEGPPYSFQWSGTPQTSNPVFALCEGSYSVTITDENGCTGTGGPYVVDFVPPVLLPPQVSAAKSCSAPQNTGEISLSITGGIPPYNYQITNGAFSQSIFSAQGVVFEDLAAGTYTYTITDNGNGVDQQNKTGTVVVGETVLSLSLVEIHHATSATQLGSINIEPAGGALPYSFSWNNGASSEDLPNAAPFCYELTLIDKNGCVQSFDDLGVGLLSATPNYVQPDCPQELGAITANVTLTPNCAVQNQPYEFKWYDTLNNQVGQNQTLNNVVPGVYTVVITDASGTSFTREFELESLSNLSVSAEVTTDFNGFGVICFNSSNGKAKAFASDGQAPYSYTWSNGSTTQEATGLAAGNHIVTIEDAEGCEMTASVVVTQPDLINTQTTASNSGCTDGPTGQATVIVTGGVSGPNCYSYNWSNGGTTATISNLDTGTFLVTVTDCNGCTMVDNVEVEKGSQLIVQAVSVPDSGGPNGVAGVTVTGGTPPYEYYWQDFPTINASEVTELFPGDYLVLVTDANDCQKALVVNVGDETLCGQVRTVITPEGDGKNEEFIIECLSRFNDNTLEIFNRWGQLVYSVEDYNDADLWRGTTTKGDDVPDGVYYYVFNYYDPGTNTFVTKKGSVTVLRK